MLVTFLIFFSWKSAYNYDCYVLFFPLLVLLVISYSFIELKMQTRVCFRDCFFKRSSLFAKILSSRVLVTVFYLILSLLMTVSALAVAIELPLVFWLYLLVVHTALIVVMYRYFDHIFINTIQDSYRGLIAREWTVNIAALLLILLVLYLSYEGFTPEYLSSGLGETVRNASNSISSDCTVISVVLKIHKEIDATFWWIMVNGDEHIGSQSLKAGSWFVFLFFNSMAILGINRFVAQIIYMIDKIFQGKNNE